MPDSNQRPHQPPPNQLPPQQQQQLQQQPPMQQRLQQQQRPPQQIAPQNPLQPNLQMPPPPPQIPQDFISFFQVMMTNQSALMERLSENIFNMKKERSTAEYTMEVLAKNIQDFHYDEENGVTFAQWFERFATTFKEDARALTEDAKVRLLLRKLGASEYSRKIFGQSESIFVHRIDDLL
ncbi:hydroxysteroid dehydrogenase-like protein 2 [Eupeodes corollae]|uniref:hydroxysteroid dehydrogenase-like protein 2 n=1 Tax=Eupeodes corollae TaxID=290404 RepID=UPI00248FC8A1|nr:hydroxysteroid dehydrogenase-like protein 2 [Eupeodes corollae]